MRYFLRVGQRSMGSTYLGTPPQHWGFHLEEGMEVQHAWLAGAVSHTGQQKHTQETPQTRANDQTSNAVKEETFNQKIPSQIQEEEQPPAAAHCAVYSLLPRATLAQFRCNLGSQGEPLQVTERPPTEQGWTQPVRAAGASLRWFTAAPVRTRTSGTTAERQQNEAIKLVLTGQREKLKFRRCTVEFFCCLDILKSKQKMKSLKRHVKV